MRVGLVCEGPTDVLAVEHFIGDQLRTLGLQPVFRNLFPEPDRTRPEGGWSNLLLWLQNNPAEARVARYFSSGLFGGGAGQEPLDAIIIQIDSDVLEDQNFRAFVQQRLNIELGDFAEPDERASAMRAVVGAAGGFSNLVDADQRRHVVVVAVEATEAWCVAAFRAQPDRFELLQGPDLTCAFMQALERFEGRTPQEVYYNCDKDVGRRARFCSQFANHSSRITQSCPQFAAGVEALSRIAMPLDPAPKPR